MSNGGNALALRGKVVVVTGASAGVGRAIVREFAKQGARLGLLARASDGLGGARKEAVELGTEALAVPTDVSDPAQVEKAAAVIEKAYGTIDIWVNDAMVSVFSPVKEMKPEEYRRVTEVTYLGYVYGTLAALKRMSPRKQGVIIQIGSALAYRSIPLQSAYCAAKHAILGFTESLRCELLHDRSKVRVTMIELPAVNTTQFGWVKSRLPNQAQPVPPIYQPEVIARAAVYAATHERREVKVGFSTLKAIFAEKIAPGLADHYLARLGYTSQQTDERRDPAQPDNLWVPIPGDRGSHGTFDRQARNFSLQLWMTERRPQILATALTAAGLGLLGWMTLQPGHAATISRGRRKIIANRGRL